LEAVKSSFRGQLVTQYHRDGEQEYAQENGILAYPGRDAPGLGRDMLHFNDNSGAQAINLAYLLGATRIILIGYDMQNTGGRAHWFGEHPHTLQTGGNYAVYVDRFARLASDLAYEGVEVINCTRETALHQFRRARLEDVYG